MVNYQAEKYKKQIKIKEESLLVHISEMDKLRATNKSLKRKIFKMRNKINALEEQLKQNK